MKLPGSIENIKGLILQRKALADQLSSYRNRVRSGYDFFMNAAGQKQRVQDLAEGVKIVTDILREMQDINREIFDIDTTLAMYYETLTMDLVVRAQTIEQENDAGETVTPAFFYFVPEPTRQDLVEVTPDDLFTLKILKAVFNARNIELVPKNDYLSHP